MLESFMGLLRNKMIDPLLSQLKQGVTPSKLAQSIGAGALIGCFPFIGISTSLCLLSALLFKLNHVAIQTVNYAVYPLQILLLIPFLKMGEWLFQATPIPLNVELIIEQFKMNFWLSLEKYAMSFVMGAVAWMIVAPIAYMFIYFISKMLLEKALPKILTRKEGVTSTPS